MTLVFGLYRVQDDDQIELGNPTRFLGFFSSEQLAQEALDAVHGQDPEAVGELEINPQELDFELWNDGFVTEYPDSD